MENGGVSQQNRTALGPILVLFAMIIVLLLILLPGQAAEPRVYFIEPLDGATLPTTFTVKMGEDSLNIEPAGEIHEGAGHFHILIDQDFIPAGEAVPANAQDLGYLHFGQGQREVELTLTPGTHTLRLQFADGAHIALEGDQYRDEITVTVTE